MFWSADFLLYYFFCGQLVLANGQVIECKGSYVVGEKFVEYYDADDRLFRVPLKLVDLTRSSQQDVAKSAPGEETGETKKKSLFDAAMDAGGTNELRQDSLNQDELATLELKYAADKRNVGTTYVDVYTTERKTKKVYKAIDERNTIALQEAVSAGGLINESTPEKPPSLHYAVAQGWVEGVEILLKAGGDPMIQWKGQQAISSLAMTKDGEAANKILLLLLKYNVDADAANKDGTSLLQLAVERKADELTRALLKAGASPLRKDRKGRCALMTVLDQGEVEILKEMLLKTNNINFTFSDGSTPLIRAVQEANPVMVACLLDRGASPNMPNTEGLSPILVSYQNDSEEIRGLLRAKGGIFSRPDDLTFLAVWLARNGNSRMLQDLAEKERIAFAKHHVEFMLQEAVKAKNGQLFAGLQALGCDLNAHMANGDTPLTLSVKMDSLETARALLKAGARVDVTNKEGFLPISLVQEQGAGEAMRKLLKAHYR